MNRRGLIVLALAAMGPAIAATLPDHPAIAAGRQADSQTLSYGPDRLQQIDYWPGSAADSPVVVFVHGGGWSRGDKRMMQGSAKLSHWQAKGYAVASLNYRLVPDATIEQEAQDVATALAYLKENSVRLGFDARKMALVGHSAGAHLVALVGTDPAFLRNAGLAFEDIAGVIPLDGACYDVGAQLEDGPRIMRDTYSDAFGNDPARQARLSPTMQAGAPNAAPFLILHFQREDGTRQSRALASALQEAGTSAEVRGFAGGGLRGHMEINRRLGEPGYPATAVVDDFLARIFS